MGMGRLGGGGANDEVVKYKETQVTRTENNTQVERNSTSHGSNIEQSQLILVETNRNEEDCQKYLTAIRRKEKRKGKNDENAFRTR